MSLPFRERSLNFIDLTGDATPLASQTPSSITATQVAEEGSTKRKSDSLETLVNERPAKKIKKYTGTRDAKNDPNEPCIIAESAEVENTPELPTGVRFEIARLMSLDKDVRERVTPEILNGLKGNNRECAPLTAKTFYPTKFQSINKDPALAPEVAATASKLSPWEELDKEEEFLSQSPYAGIGNSDIAPGWYGGKIVFRGRLDRVGQTFTVKLERPALGPSCRFTRRFGSKNFLRIKVPNPILHSCSKALGEFFKKPFILYGDVFRAFYAKDTTVFLLRTNEIMVRGEIRTSGNRLSLLQFLEWHNPLEGNVKQAMAKWAARTALGLSNSVPGPVVESENITYINDIVSTTDSEMTDGCGLTNRATTIAISRMIGPQSYSVAFQFRLAGGKGMLLEELGTSSNDSIKVSIRPSQTKIRYPSNHQSVDDPTFRTIDLLRVVYMRSPAVIAPELIINLAENGVPNVFFRSLLRNSLTGVVDGFTNWDGQDAMYGLWKHVERTGAVLSSRRARESVGESRFRGYGGYSIYDEDDNDEDGLDIDNADRSVAWWADQTSGSPSSLEETVLSLLDSGFHPKTCPVLGSKLKSVVSSKIRNMTSKYRYELPHSAVAFAVPDHTGTLGPNEIHFKSSQNNLSMPEGPTTDLITGNVVMLRYPCKLPTDARKVQAVENPLLRNYVDVVVCSVQGERRLLDFLAGGDYDGDMVTVIWAPEVNQNFVNADEKFLKEPLGLDSCFELAHNESVGVFIKRSTALTKQEKISQMQTYLLGSLRDPSIVPKYSKMHNNSIYELGYANPRTIKLAYKFCKVLDGAKTGLRIKEQTFHSDRKEYDKTRGPEWEVAMKDQENSVEQPIRGNLSKMTPRGTSKIFIKGEFIMDYLQRQSKRERERALKLIDDLFDKVDKTPDSDLTQPWYEALARASTGTTGAQAAKENDLKKIRTHVEWVYQEHGKRLRIKFTSQSIEKRQDILRELSRMFHASPTLDEMEVFLDAASISRIRASYAYVYDCKQKFSWSRFPWNVAFRDLCQIKAAALGPHKTTTQGFYERFKMGQI